MVTSMLLNLPLGPDFRQKMPNFSKKFVNSINVILRILLGLKALKSLIIY